MHTGVSYMGQPSPKHLRTDFADMAGLGCDEVLVAMQENDFVHKTGVVDLAPVLAKDAGLRPVAIFWGVLNVFGGGRSSQFLLEHTECHQVTREGAWHPEGCYVHPDAVARIREMITRSAEAGYAGYFIDEPTPIDCYCPACRARYEEWVGGDLREAGPETLRPFRRRCVLHYIEVIAAYVKDRHPGMETSCCVMPCDRDLWEATARIDGLDNLGTDIYWVNEDRDLEAMRPVVRDLDALCAAHGKAHHEWLQCWIVGQGREERIRRSGEILLAERPDHLWVWAYEGQAGMAERCDDPERAWAMAKDVLRMARETP